MPDTENTSTDKITIIATHGTDEPELLSLPFIIGNAALAMDTAVTVVLQGSAVFAATKSCIQHVLAQAHPPLSKLVADFLEFGGSLLVCMPCLEVRNIPNEKLIEGAQPVKAARVVTELLDSKATLSY